MITVFIEYDRISKEQASIDENRVSQTALAVFEKQTIDNSEITIIFTNNDHIRQINREFREKDYPTDVISFAYMDDPFPGEGNENDTYLGDIYISVEKAAEQAEEFGSPYEQEIDRLVIHAILHLMGYDHEKGENEAELMFSLEDSIATECEQRRNAAQQ